MNALFLLFSPAEGQKEKQETFRGGVLFFQQLTALAKNARPLGESPSRVALSALVLPGGIHLMPPLIAGVTT